jgi:hypothetical protein
MVPPRLPKVAIQQPFWGDVSLLHPLLQQRAFQDAGRDEDFRAGTDSKAAPEGGLRLGLLALRCSSFAPAEPIQKDFASDEEPYD